MEDTTGIVIDGETFQVDVDAYSGPIEMLVDLVRLKKVDVSSVPVLAIVEEFLFWLRTAMNSRLELAAEWLLMAATLAHMKSRLLLPTSREEKSKAEAAVEDLVTRLRRMQALRSFAEELGRRRRLGVHWFEPGDADAGGRSGKRMDSTLYVMLAAYVSEARITLRPAVAPVRKPFLVFSVDDAIALVRAVCEATDDWTSIFDMPHAEPAVDRIHARSRVASSFVASLELAKRGVVEVRQSGEAVEVRARREDDLEAA